MSIEIKFCGAAGIVTGSCYLIKTPKGQFLVDCGMFQGTKTVRELNYGDFSFKAEDLSFVLLTHAHIDHSGLLPKLYKEGFTGHVYTTEATKDLLEYMLPDSAYIQETEVRRLNQRNKKRGMPSVKPIYTQSNVDDCLNNINFVKIDGWIDLPLGIKARYWNAGHILGSASIEINIPNKKDDNTTVVFSGDLGPDNKMFQNAPDSPHDIDYLVVESTYGSRTREDPTIEKRRNHLKDEILEATSKKGNIIIPAFAVERTQEILMDIDWLISESKIPEIPVFIDSPLATKVTEVFKKHRCELEDMSGTCSSSFASSNIHYTHSVDESKALNLIKSGAIIMSASGMCEAGRIRHHLKNNLWNPAATILFVGYQAEGTLGRLLQSGEKNVRIHGEEIEVKARIRSIETYSAHADQKELANWVKARMPVNKNIFITHGVDESREGMIKTLESMGMNKKLFLTPSIGEVFKLDGSNAEKTVNKEDSLKNREITARTDWHNEYARFVLDLAQSLRNMPVSSERHLLLKELSSKISIEPNNR